MRKSLSRNPNMMRTMIGIGLVLILVLSYAVYSNTLDSEYYGYTTTNEEVELDMQETEEGSAEWHSTTISKGYTRFSPRICTRRLTLVYIL